MGLDSPARRATVSRRSLLAACAAGLTAITAEGWSEDTIPVLEFDPGSWVLRNSLTGDVAHLSPFAPLFDLGDCQVGGPAAGPVQLITAGPGRWNAMWHVVAPRPATIRAQFAVDAHLGVMRKVASLRLEGGRPALLRHVVVDEVDASGQAFSHRADIQSHPAFGRSFFCGIEFPIAAVQAAADHATLAHAPGMSVKPGAWCVSRAAVYGAAPAGDSRAAFERYIAALRPRPQGIHFNYNSWWTSPVPYTEADILAIVEAFRKDLFKPYGVSPNSFCIDMGWAKNTTLWQIDPALFPRGFAPLQRACAGIDSRLGLWISPSGVYGQALDPAWAQKAGYEADNKACLAGPKYRTAFTAALLDIARKYRLGHVKFDGYVPTCDARDHGHEPGALSAEPIAEGMIAVFAALRRVAPDVWMEPTCFGPASSPWWLAHANSVTGAFGDDAPHGRAPCPTYRESYTTGRDYYNLKGARDIPFPIAGQEVLGIIHQTPEPLQNDAVTTVLRGNQFVSLYVNPAHMSPRRWEFLAALMRWSRRNQQVLAETRPLLPRSWRQTGGGPGLTEESAMPREPYGYAHWKGSRGLICLRNPWVEPAVVEVVPAADCGAPPGSRVWAASVYPDRTLAARRAVASEPMRVHLGPYETRVLELSTVGAAPDVPPAAAPAPPVVRISTRSSRLVTKPPQHRYGPDYTVMTPPDGPCLQVVLTGEVAGAGPGVPALLLLVEGPGPIVEPQASLTVDGSPVSLQAIDSESGWRATGRPVPEHWFWLTAELPAGSCKVEGRILLSSPDQSVSAWAAARQETAWTPLHKVDGAALPPPEERWLSSLHAFGPLRLAEELPVELGETAVVRIAGVYLDTLQPASVEQGWGTLQRNRSVWEKPMRVGGRRFPRGLGTHAPSRIVYDLGGRYRRFQAWAGADQATGPTITMEVRVDGRSVWKSDLLTRESAAQRVDVDVAGAHTLELLVGDGGNGLAGDHADWADAILTDR